VCSSDLKTERDKVRLKYCHRKIVWDAVEEPVQWGLTSDMAIDRIYSECGGPNSKVNEVIEELSILKGLEMLLCICML
jgi:hypothetical protein